MSQLYKLRKEFNYFENEMKNEFFHSSHSLMIDNDKLIDDLQISFKNVNDQIKRVEKQILEKQ